MKIASVGEVMIEVISEMPQANETRIFDISALAFGGPIINIAWYIKMLGLEVTPFAFIGQRDREHLAGLLSNDGIDGNNLMAYDGFTDMVVSMTTPQSHHSHYYRAVFSESLLAKLKEKLYNFDVVIINGSRHPELLAVYGELLNLEGIQTVFNPGYSISAIENLELLRLLLLESDIVTLNEHETQYAHEVLGLDFEHGDFEQDNMVVLTKSNQGSVVITKNQKYSMGSMTKVKQDVIGAGDAYLSAFLCHYSDRENLVATIEMATACAALVVECGDIRSLISPEGVKKRVEQWRNK